jgi:prophage regulatory protein
MSLPESFMDKLLKPTTPRLADVPLSATPSRIPGLSKHDLFMYLYSEDAKTKRNVRFRGMFGNPGVVAVPVLSVPPVRYLRRRQVEHITGLATSSVYRLVQAGGLPKPYQLSANTVGWKESEILEWCKTRKPRRRKDGLTVDLAVLIGGSNE